MNIQGIYDPHQNTPFIACPSRSIRPEEAYDLFRTGRTAARVARFIGLPFNETVDLITEGQQARHDRELKRAVADARLSVLARPQRVN